MGLKAKNPVRYEMLLERLKKDVTDNRKVLEALASVQWCIFSIALSFEFSILSVLY